VFLTSFSECKEEVSHSKSTTRQWSKEGCSGRPSCRCCWCFSCLQETEKWKKF